MKRINEARLREYVRDVGPDQSGLLLYLRKLILEGDKDVAEQIQQGKWLHGYLFYTTLQKKFVYALGFKSSKKVSIHLMPYYASSEYQKRYGNALKPYLSGKSCLDFSCINDVPASILSEIIRHGSTLLDSAAH